jgi:uncharacterized protein
MLRVGLISDTHGLVRPQASAFLQGCDHIIHAGDICEPGVLETLSKIAPVTAVRGNNDHGEWAAALAARELLQFDEVRIEVLHDLADLDREPVAAGVNVVISGHSHKPLLERREGVIFINPGSAGPRRFRLPVAVGELLVSGASVTPRIVLLDVETAS